MEVSGRYVAVNGGEPVAIVMESAEADRIREDLVARGYEVQDVSASGGEIEVFQECTTEDPRPCEVTVALGIAQSLAREAGVDSSEVDALEARGSATEEEARAAVVAVAGRLPADMQPQGQALIEAAWPDG